MFWGKSLVWTACLGAAGNNRINQMPNHILIIDDDEKLLHNLSKLLSACGYPVKTLANSRKAEELLREQSFDCILLDLFMPGGLDGAALLKTILKKFPGIPVIMISGEADIASAVQCVQEGAYDFIEKSPDMGRLLTSVKNALEKRRLEVERAELAAALQKQYQLIGNSKAIVHLQQEIRQVATTNARVLILGENGTGKELVAGAIHHYSQRSGKPYITLNCAAIPPELMESELFGHVKGAFTGAIGTKEGRFWAADGGTLFLDEIGDMNFELQAKLLRALARDRIEINRIGENFPKTVDVRIISATNKNLHEMISKGSFREDLFYRLNVVTLRIPPLRERPEDILPLANHFLQQANNTYNKQVRAFSNEAVEFFIHYPWPGNVRQLRHLIENLVIYSKEDEQEISGKVMREKLEASQPLSTPVYPMPGFPPSETTLDVALKDCEKKWILATLYKCGWKIQQTANALGLNRASLFKKMRRYGITKSQSN